MPANKDEYEDDADAVILMGNDNGMRISRYLPVKGGSTITLSVNIALPNLTNYDICFYDAENTGNGSVDLIYGTTTAEVSENASSFRIGFDSNDDGKTITYFPA